MSAINPILFYILAGAALAFSVMTVLRKNPVTSAFCLVMVFFCFAGIYALLGAHLIAALQVLVYAGAVMVLFVFVVMLLNSDTPSFDLNRTPVALRAGAAVICFILFAAFVMVFRKAPAAGQQGPFTIEAVAQSGGNTQVLSELMFSEYVLPVELTSVLLVAAIVGAVALAKRHSARALESSKNNGASHADSRA